MRIGKSYIVKASSRESISALIFIENGRIKVSSGCRFLEASFLEAIFEWLLSASVAAPQALLKESCSDTRRKHLEDFLNPRGRGFKK